MRSPVPEQTIPPDVIAVVRESFNRCCSAKDFFSCFYRWFFRARPETEPLFAKTDFPHDPQFNGTTEDAWPCTLASRVAYMQSRYR
jgi:hypothetical protein